MDDELMGELLDVERRGWESLCDGTGAGFYGELMTPDALMVLANGSVLDREAVVDSLQHAPRWRTFTVDHPRLVRAGSDSAALVYLGTAWRDGTEPAFTGVMTSWYRRVDDAWRLVVYQQTPVER